MVLLLLGIVEKVKNENKLRTNKKRVIFLMQKQAMETKLQKKQNRSNNVSKMSEANH